MPINVLFIEDNTKKQEALKSCLKNNSGIKFRIISSFKNLSTEIESNNYTHLATQLVIDDQSFLELENKINIPILLINDADLDLTDSLYSYTNSPLSYPKLFAFLSENTPISYNTLEEYAMGDVEFLQQLKVLIVEEFEINFKDIPTLIKANNLVEIKSRAHQMVSKFSMLNMPVSFKLSKEIDLNILKDSETQIKNMEELLVDIEIAISHLK